MLFEKYLSNKNKEFTTLEKITAYIQERCCRIYNFTFTCDF